MEKQSMGEVAPHEEAVVIKGIPYTVHSIQEIGGGIPQNPSVVKVAVHLRTLVVN
jgi:hypothetical protein